MKLLSSFIVIFMTANSGAAANASVPVSSTTTSAENDNNNGLDRKIVYYEDLYDEPNMNEKHQSRTKSRMNEKASEDRRLAFPERILMGGNIGEIFARSYTCICLSQDFAYVVPEGGRSDQTFLDAIDDPNRDTDFYPGVSYIQGGGCFDPVDVPIVSREAGTSAADQVQKTPAQGGLNSNFPNGGTPNDNQSGRFPFAGRRQAGRIPQSDPGFFYTSQCTGVSGGGSVDSVTGISCLINLCLGGGGFNCLGIYSGVGYTFNPLDQVTSFTNPNKNGSRERLFPFNSPRPFQNAPALPPSFPGTIFGGTGSFVGAKGTVEITTVAAQTAIAIDEGNPFGDVSGPLLGPQSGFIVTKVSVVTNVPLPPAP
jgi:hypothetical protein